MAGKVTTQLVIEGKNNSKQAFNEVSKQVQTLNSQLSTAGKALGAYLSVSALTGAVRGVVEVADSWKLMEARLKLATGSQDEFNRAQQELSRIAGATATPMESLVTLYGRISRPLKEAGRSQQEILAVTEAVAGAFRVSGASAQEAENGVIQFAQALGSGALRGDEFNSVAEQAPRLMQALADGIGVPVSALKDLAKQGQLTADVVTDALVGQLPTINAELEAFGASVSGEMVQIRDAISEGIGNADTGPLVESLQELKATLKDPVVIANVTALAGALVKLAEGAARGAAALGQSGKDLGIFAAQVAGNLDELTKVDTEIEAIKASLDDSWSPGDLFTDLFFSRAELEEKLAALQQTRTNLIAELSGMSQEAVNIAEQQAAQVKAAQDKELEGRRQWVSDTKQVNDQLIKDGEDALKKRVEIERKAAADLEKAKAAQLETEKRYRDLIAKLQGGGTGGDPQFSDVTALKAGARQALQRGDLEAAKQQAQQAAEILQQLAEAGENTYGFVGLAKELQAIEGAADSAAEDRMKVIAVQTEALKQNLEALKAVTIAPTLDQVAANEVAQQMKDFAASIGQTVTITPVTAMPAAPVGTGAQGFAGGGHVRGPGSGTSDSILARLSNGEYVLRAAAVRKYGTDFLDRMNGLRLPGFSDGGLVEAAMSIKQPSMPDLGRLEMVVDGQSFPVHVSGSTALDLQRLSRKKGATSRRI